MCGIGRIGRIGQCRFRRGGVAPPLDTLTGSAAAYSLRRLRTAYAGSAIRVRRSNDNAELDIGFTADGNINTSALLTHCGANSGFITTWYDQSTNARNLAQTTASAQPRIVNAGVFDNGVNFNDALHLMNSTGIPATYRASLVGAPLGAGAYRTLIWSGANQHPLLLENVSTAVGSWNGAFAAAGSLTWGNGELATFWCDAATTTIAIGKNGAATASTGVTTSTTPSIIGNSTSGQQFGLVREMVFLPATATAGDRQFIERNQGLYYGITVI